MAELDYRNICECSFYRPFKMPSIIFIFRILSVRTELDRVFFLVLNEYQIFVFDIFFLSFQICFNLTSGSNNFIKQDDINQHYSLQEIKICCESRAFASWLEPTTSLLSKIPKRSAQKLFFFFPMLIDKS